MCLHLEKAVVLPAHLIRLHILSSICENPPSCKFSITVLSLVPFEAFKPIVFKVYPADQESAIQKARHKNKFDLLRRFCRCDKRPGWTVEGENP